MAYELILVDTPAEYVRRITLNRPEKRNAISTPLRNELLDALRAHDNDPDVRVTIVRGAGPCFSSGYDLTGGPLMEGAPFYSAPGDGQWARQANDTWFSVWDLAKPVIAQIHGYAIAGGTELASACDLVYVAEDATISYPVVRVVSPPDWQYHTVLLGLRRAMELMLTGDPITGVEAAAIGFANRAFPADELDQRVLDVACRVAGVPSDLTQINKRSIHRAFDVWGARAAIRAGTELQALAGHTETAARMRDQLLASVKQAGREQASPGAG
jgi:enoyl-CoA hydratase